MNRLIGVYGASGCGKGIMPLICGSERDAEHVFIDDKLAGTRINNHPVLDWTEFLGRNEVAKSVCIAIANSRIREKLASRCDQENLPLESVRAENVVIMDNVLIEDGACLSPFVTLTSNIRIGRSFHANLYSCVEHDCIVGDFVTLAPGAIVNGNVTLGDHAYVGAGALIRQGLVIGPNAIVGMGAVVTHDVPAGVTVVGNPARPIRENR